MKKPPDSGPKDTTPSQRVEKELRALLADPSAIPHSPFLSEVELQARFKVNVATARKAVRRLVDEGLLYKRHRVGTFVAPTVRNRLILLVSTNPDFSTISHLTAVASEFPDLQWQEVLAEELRANINEIHLIYPRLIGVIFVRDLPHCIDVISGLNDRHVPTFFYGSDVHLPFLKLTHSLLYAEANVTTTALDHLKTSGAKSIGFLGSYDWAAFSARYQHFLEWQDTKKQKRNPANAIVLPQATLDDPADCFKILRKRLKDKEFTADAIFCSNDQCATILVQAALSVGISIPKRLQVIGVEDDEILSMRTFPQITSVYIPMGLDIQRAVGFLSENAHKPQSGVARLECELDLVERGTTHPIDV